MKIALGIILILTQLKVILNENLQADDKRFSYCVYFNGKPHSERVIFSTSHICIQILHTPPNLNPTELYYIKVSMANDIFEWILVIVIYTFSSRVQIVIKLMSIASQNQECNCVPPCINKLHNLNCTFRFIHDRVSNCAHNWPGFNVVASLYVNNIWFRILLFVIIFNTQWVQHVSV